MAGGDADCGCTPAEQQQQEQQQQPARAPPPPAKEAEAAGTRRPAAPAPPPAAAPASMSPCDVEALKRCLIEHDGDQRRCQAEVEAFKRACGMVAASPNQSSS